MTPARTIQERARKRANELREDHPDCEAAEDDARLYDEAAAHIDALEARLNPPHVATWEQLLADRDAEIAKLGRELETLRISTARVFEETRELCAKVAEASCGDGMNSVYNATCEAVAENIRVIPSPTGRGKE